MSTPKYKVRVIGRREFVDFPELGLFQLEAKIDTGAYTSAIHCKEIELITIEGVPNLCFRLLDESHPEHSDTVHRFTNFSKKVIRNSFGEEEERYIIQTKIKLGRKTILTTISLSDRESMRYPVLIGRRMLQGKFVVDVEAIHTRGIKFKRKK